MGQKGSARLTVHSRLAIAKRVTEEGWSITEAAVAASVSLLRHVPVILVTALDTMEDQAHGADVGADAYITKAR